MSKRKIVLRAEARLRGLPRYFTGASCKHGHTAERWTAKGVCVACLTSYAATGAAKERKAARHRRRMDDPDYRAARLRYAAARYAASPELRARLADNQRRRLADPVKRRRQIEQSTASRRMKNFGVSAAEYAKRLTTQECKCALCARRTEVCGTLHVDHNHDTGEVRGLLCRECNLSEGLLAKVGLDPLDWAARLVQYLTG